MKLKYAHIILLGLIILSSFTLMQKSETSSELKLYTSKTSYEAGSLVFLKLSNPNRVNSYLYATNSYGSILIKPILKNNILFYEFPKAFSNKVGVINWRINKTKLSGQLKITPIQKVAKMETYIGPPSIQAVHKDFSMLTVIPTDSLDNPLAENTKVTVKHQFLNEKESSEILTKNLIAYKNIYAPLKSGRMLVSSECLGKNSKEFTIIVHPSNPTDFSIYADRHHSYADGNQITTFYSSKIKDKQNNIVSDGTFVTFYITNDKGNSLKTTGTTVKGIATAKMIHPDYKTSWSVKAYIEGMAESDMIQLTYKQALKDFDVAFSDKNRSVKVGPLRSFMKQMIPDGLGVKLLIYKNDALINIENKTSYNGFVTFTLNTAVYPEGNYDLKIRTAGLEKEFKRIKIW